MSVDALRVVPMFIAISTRGVEKISDYQLGPNIGGDYTKYFASKFWPGRASPVDKLTEIGPLETELLSPGVLRFTRGLDNGRKAYSRRRKQMSRRQISSEENS
jgi:hypothetical protein